MAYDAIIIGGGITGAGVLRDLSLRGLKALLLEKGRPAGGTTVASSHLIHGGLRYLLYDRLTTHASCWDSGHILRIARPLLTRLPVVWPVYRGHAHGLATVETLLESYDRFQPMKEGRPHLRLSAEETLRLFPGLSADGLRGALSFDEWWVDPEALVLANLDSARRHGGEVRVPAEAVGLERRGAAVTGVRARGPDGREESLAAAVVVNAAGPWADRAARLAGVEVPLRLRQGVHLVYEGYPPFLTASGRPAGLLLEAEDRGRYVFVIPQGGMTLVGPTDTATDRDPDRLVPSEEEKRCLLASVKRYFPSFPERYARVIVGARPILGQTGSEKLLSRDFEVLDHSVCDGAPGFVTVAGGKMSDFRLMAQEAGEAVCRLLGRGGPASSHLETLDGLPVGGPPESLPPSARLKRFLRSRPRLREGHALLHLAWAFGRHLLHPSPASSLEDFRRHYAA